MKAVIKIGWHVHGVSNGRECDSIRQAATSHATRASLGVWFLWQHSMRRNGSGSERVAYALTCNSNTTVGVVIEMA